MRKRSNFPFTLKFALCVLFILVASSIAFSESLEQHQGSYWKWTAPHGWHHSESVAGVTLTSPDGQYTAALAGLMGSQGSTTPKEFISRMLGKAYRNIRIVSLRNLPSQKMGYQTWHWVEAEAKGSNKSGAPIIGVWRGGVANYYNRNDAVIMGYWAPPAKFQSSKALLNSISRSIILTNSRQAFGNDQIIHPRNHPNTTGDTIMQTWENKNKSHEKSMEKWSNTMRGNEPAFDPATGQRYSVPLTSWNPAKGGYVNPHRPTELLQCGTPEKPHPCER